MASLQILVLILLLPTAWVLYSCYCLLLNYMIARKIGVPLVIVPISHENPLWMVVDKKISYLYSNVFLLALETLRDTTGVGESSPTRTDHTSR